MRKIWKAMHNVQLSERCASVARIAKRAFLSKRSQGRRSEAPFCANVPAVSSKREGLMNCDYDIELSREGATGEADQAPLGSVVGVGSGGDEVAVAIIEQIDELPTTLDEYLAYQRETINILRVDGCYGERFQARELVCKRWNASLLSAFAFGVDSQEFQDQMTRFQSGCV